MHVDESDVYEGCLAADVDDHASSPLVNTLLVLSPRFNTGCIVFSTECGVVLSTDLTDGGTDCDVVFRLVSCEISGGSVSVESLPVASCLGNMRSSCCAVVTIR